MYVPPQKMRKSISQVNMFNTCQRKYEYAYVKGIKVPDHPLGEILLIGNLVHDYAKEWLTKCLHDWGYLNKWDEFMPKYMQKYDKEVDNYRREDFTRDDVDTCLREFTKYILNKITKTEEILGVEKELWSDVGGNHPTAQTYKGYIDFYTNKRLYDWKVTASNPKYRDLTKDKKQMGLYCATMKIYSARNVYFFIKKKNKSARFEIQEYEYDFTPEDLQNIKIWAWKIGRLMDHHIQDEFFQANPSSFLCNEKYCQFYKQCSKE